ncbi:MAG: hypothetical protein ACJ8AG_29920 [Ktedonobacteraceae bacterium]
MVSSCQHKTCPNQARLPGGLARSESKRGGKKTVDAPEQPISQPPDEIVEPVQARTGPALPVIVPLSLPEVRRLYWYLVSARPLVPLHRLAWSLWRRSHQVLAKLCHYKRHMAHLHYLQL